MEKELLKRYRELHPEWTEEQIQVYYSLGHAADITVSENKDVDPNDPDVIKGIITQAREWLKNNLPDLFAKVAVFFDNLIATFGEWVSKGLTYALNSIEYLYQKGKIVAEALKQPIN